MNEIYIVICEGESEFPYIQELNKFLRDNEIEISLVAKTVGTGIYKTVVEKFTLEREKDTKKPNNEFIIWIDKDIYLRSEKEKNNYKNKDHCIPDFYFNYLNFEDFLFLHLSYDILRKYIIKLDIKKHFEKPLIDKEYLKIVTSFFPHYKKGEMPIEINKNSLDNLIKNHKDSNVKINSDFVKFIEKIIK